MSTERKNQKSLSRKIVFTVAFVLFVLYSVAIFVIFLQEIHFFCELVRRLGGVLFVIHLH
jgi:hypothetical protein